MYFDFHLDQAANLVSRLIFNLCCVCAIIFLLAACSTVGGLVESSIPPQQCNPTELRTGAVIDTATGRVISMDELIARLSNVSIVYIGETHTSLEDHKIQLEILRRLSNSGRCVELAMEMFPVEAQPVLTRYVMGQTSEEEFLKEVRWDKVWGFPYSYYRNLINWQKEKHMPVLGINAPIEVVRKIGHNGLASLTPDERDRVALEFHLDDPANRERIRTEYSVHLKGQIEGFETFFEAQLAWEETMAQTLTERLDKDAANCIIVVAIGKGHISDRLGAPYLASLRRQNEYKTVAPIPIDYPSCTTDPDIADYVVITAESAASHPPRLGIVVQPASTNRGLEILEVMPDSPAAQAHLRKGDIILSIDGSSVESVENVQKALAEGGPNYKILIKRNKKELSVNATIQR